MPDTAVAGTVQEAETRPVAAVDEAAGVRQARGLVWGRRPRVIVATLRAPSPP